MINKIKHTKNKYKKINKLNKKGFAFSILSLFLVFLIFGFGSLYLFQSDFTQDSEFRESRILYINGEIDYFKESYLKSSLQFSAYNAFNELTIYLDDNNKFNIINKNPEKLNELILEGITKGTFETNPIANLNDKNMDYLTQIFKDNFKNNYHGNFSFNILNLSLFESQSYFIDIQLLTSYVISTEDNLSSWNFTDEIIIQVPVTDLLDPEFLSRGDKKVPIRSSEFHLPTLNWTFKNFNETVAESYSTVYYKPAFDYTIGQSYLKRLMGITKGDYYGVVKSFTFDTDEEYNGIYDNAVQSVQGNLFGNTLMLIDFNNLTSNLTHILDRSTYESNIPKTLDMNCTSFGNIWQESCHFSKQVPITNHIFPINFSDTFSISTWFNYNLTTTDIILIGNPTFNLGIEHPSKKVFFEFKDDLGGTTKVFSNSTVNESIWTHLAVTYSGSEVSMYVKGLLTDTISVPGPLIQTITNQYIGTPTASTIDLSLDELAIYSKTLTSQEVSKLYVDRFVSRIDYVDSVFGRGIKFDGVDDFIKLNLTPVLTDNHTVGVWFKLDEYQDGSSDEVLLLQDPYIAIKNGTNKLRYYNYGVNDFNVDPYYEGNQIIELNKWYYVVTVYDGVANTYSMYVNGELDAQQVGKNSLNSGIRIDYIGGEPGTSGGRFLNGVIDEIKIYNRVLDIDEIKLNYRNYDSFGKGCCNYVTLVNQNLLGFNNVAYNHTIASSSTLFFNHYNNAEWYNVTLYDTTNFSSQVPGDEYYNLILDTCLFEVYNFLDYDDEIFYVPPRNDGHLKYLKCENLISDGFY